jgi:hypothetical protein
MCIVYLKIGYSVAWTLSVGSVFGLRKISCSPQPRSGEYESQCSKLTFTLSITSLGVATLAKRLAQVALKKYWSQ